jgi:hypothetical protein
MSKGWIQPRALASRADRGNGQWRGLKEFVRRAGYVSALILGDRTAIIRGFTAPARLKSTPLVAMATVPWQLFKKSGEAQVHRMFRQLNCD